MKVCTQVIGADLHQKWYTNLEKNISSPVMSKRKEKKLGGVP
jgi:hypothetical protein